MDAAATLSTRLTVPPCALAGVFNHYEYAFKAHFPVPSWILFRMVFNVIPEWVPGLFPIGFSL